ncbi:sensor domain-containing diguanylate cyclase [Ferrimonas lipolytica]|uniref:diguanylate cyclase n=1 Tax=Ferrimonas lipolytica TaxID=2724191 RepID=A0A6H1UHU4_9GAMM|nr:sensor domain-containing diguanylate cyclase [Ferrimonas lipolytica]QIZ78398.1 sensor domain-containing diguanylate cyclase [Ferrimonas lipolytica]
MTEINVDSTYGVIIVQDMNAVHVDENYAHIYGYDSPADLLNNIDSFLDLIAEDMHRLARENYNQIVAGNLVPRGHTFSNVDRNGREFTVFSVDHLIEWNGKPALQVTVIDMSAIVKSNQRIREKDLMYKRLITQSGQGVMVHRNFKPLMVNQAWVEIMHADSVEQVLALDSLIEIVPEAAREASLARYQDIISGKIVGQSNVVENHCFDGIKRFFNIYDNVIEWDNQPAVQVVLEDVTEKVRLEQIVKYRASHDELTDLYNRRAIYDWLDTQLNDHCGNDLQMTCMLLDIDDFKMVNDDYGHHSGDKVIQALADTIKKFINPIEGAVGRWGGEEFIVFISNMNAVEAGLIADNIRIEFAEIVHQYEPRQFSATVSIGISVLQDCNGLDKTENLIKAADSCLYLAKANGKNRVCTNG